jgi:hypothetical protein
MEINDILLLLEQVTVDKRHWGLSIEPTQQIIPELEARLTSGASKYCYVPKKEKFVIKFPQTLKDLRDDECKQEAAFYQNSSSFRIQKLLLETKFIGKNSHGVPFYIQPKIDFTARDIPNLKEKNIII